MEQPPIKQQCFVYKQNEIKNNTSRTLFMEVGHRYTDDPFSFVLLHHNQLSSVRRYFTLLVYAYLQFFTTNSRSKQMFDLEKRNTWYKCEQKMLEAEEERK